MNRIILLTVHLLVFVCHTNILSAQKKNKCNPKELCNSIIGQVFTTQEKELLIRNWIDFAGESLEESFPIVAGKRLNVVSIRLDGLGCIYPSFVKDHALKKYFLHKKLTQKNYAKVSFFDVYRNTQGRKLLEPYFEQELTTQLSADIDLKNSGRGDIDYASAFYQFREQWNAKFLQEKITEIKKLIKLYSIKQVFFFVHGFNVPYALAHLQGNALFRDVINQLPSGSNTDEVLFVRVFWPALSEKKVDILDGNCKIGNKGLEVFKTRLYSFVSNRGYLCGATLNSIIYEFPSNVQINLMTHSFGSTLTCAAILSPRSKMGDTSSPYNSHLLKVFDNLKDISDRQMNFFMHAAGMPGQKSFADINTTGNRNHFFYIGYNNRDKMLLKNQIPLIKLPGKKSATTLGCDHRGEVDSVKAIAARAGLDGHFISRRTSFMRKHDLSCYKQQEGFKAFFSQYIKDISERIP